MFKRRKEQPIINSPTVVKVGNNRYKIFQDFDPRQAVIQVITPLVIKDENGEEKIFNTSTPGWRYEKI